MAKILDLSAQPRNASGTVSVRRLRKTGRIPAVVYGKKHENKNLELDSKTFAKLLQSSSSDNILVNLKIEGETAESLALVQEVQHEYLRGGILHVDFHAVAADEEIHQGSGTGREKGWHVGAHSPHAGSALPAERFARTAYT
ncbi:MAG: 50S ribosomal protein L25 [Verrucomicrobia bacterium]|nr:50S ribosomal protein L25 [Verrucomicrobiota bacterium]